MLLPSTRLVINSVFTSISLLFSIFFFVFFFWAKSYRTLLWVFDHVPGSLIEATRENEKK